jgi:SAM-dependent methyltransferase
MRFNLQIGRTINKLRYKGLPYLAGVVRSRLFPIRSTLVGAVRTAVENRVGLEIGGPSSVFQKKLGYPIYPLIERLDNVNYAARTAWEAGLHDQGDFVFAPNRQPGMQYIREATSLTGIENQCYDFVLSAHCLEHIANPLKALKEWQRVVKRGGSLVLVLPDPVRTFDHRRPLTTLAHLRADFENNTQEDDMTHLDEILRFHDLNRDLDAQPLENFRARSLKNAENRCLHHHVFNLPLMHAMLEETHWTILGSGRLRLWPLHLVALGCHSSAA